MTAQTQRGYFFLRWDGAAEDLPDALVAHFAPILAPADNRPELFYQRGNAHPHTHAHFFEMITM